MRRRTWVFAALFGIAIGCGHREECEDGRDCGDDEYCFIKRDGRSRCLERPEGWTCDDWGEGARPCADGSIRPGVCGSISGVPGDPDNPPRTWFTVDCS